MHRVLERDARRQARGCRLLQGRHHRRGQGQTRLHRQAGDIPDRPRGREGVRQGGWHAETRSQAGEVSGRARSVRRTRSMFFFAKSPDRRIATTSNKKRARRRGCASGVASTRASFRAGRS